MTKSRKRNGRSKAAGSLMFASNKASNPGAEDFEQKQRIEKLTLFFSKGITDKDRKKPKSYAHTFNDFMQAKETIKWLKKASDLDVNTLHTIYNHAQGTASAATSIISALNHS